METIGDAVKNYNKSLITGGDYEHEDDAKEAFLSAFSLTGCFKIFRVD
jgi:hypothetical protein